MFPKLVIRQFLSAFVKPIIGTTAALLGAGLAGLAGSAISGISASKAAGSQADAANNAAALQKQSADEALAFQKQQYGNSLQMLNPYLQTGYGALGTLRGLMGIGGAMPQGFNLPNQAPSNQPGNASGLNPGLNGGIGGGGVLPIGFGSNPNVGNIGPIMMANAQGGSIQVPQVPSSTNANGNFSVPTAGGTTANGNFSVPNTGGSTLQGANGLPPGVMPMTGGGNASNGNMALGNQDFSVSKLDANGNPIVDANGNATGGGFGSLITPYGQNFTSPTDVTEANDPGYQFRLSQGQKALENSAAARGGLLSGGTAKALNDYAQGSASNEYGNVYNRALQNYMTNYNQWTNDQTNQFNRLAALSGMGQTAGNQLSAAGITTGGNIGNTLLNSAGQIGQNINNAGAARGSGYVGIGNAVSGGISGIGNLALLSQILKQGNAGGAGV